MKIYLILAFLVFVFVPPASCEEVAPDKPQVVIDTSMGKIIIELSPEKAPKTVGSFLAYVKAGNYDGSIFHRVIPSFMIQGGGFDPDMKKNPTRQPIQNEADNGLKNDRGTVAMARTRDPHSATNQFFINTVNNDFLNHKSKDQRGWGYTVFGRVIEGMDVVDAISRVKTGIKQRMRDVPLDTVIIRKVTVRD